MYQYAVGEATKEEVELIGQRAEKFLQKYIRRSELEKR
jgi:hypothetical protein